MKTATMFSAIAASAAVVSAQVTLQNGTYTCAKPNVAYCAGGSLKTDIIIRCNAQSQGQPGRCGDNLAGEPPLGNTPALCYQTGETTGDAACEKNCVVYGGSGNGNGTFTLGKDLCTPTYTASTASSTTTVTTATGTSSGSATTTVDTTVTTTTCPSSSSQGSQTTQTAPPTTTSASTTTTSRPSNGSTTTSARPTQVTAAAAVNVGPGALAALGLAAAYLL